MGIIVQGKELWRALFTRTRRRVLGLLFGYPERSFYANEIVRLAGVGTGSVQRELARLTAAGLLVVKPVGNQKHYRANTESPFYPELRSLVVKTYGALAQLRGAFKTLGAEVEVAFVYGAGADALAAPGGELDILVISDDLKRADIEPVIRQAGEKIGRSIRLVLLSSERFRSLLETDDEKLMAVLEQPRLLLAGTLPET